MAAQPEIALKLLETPAEMDAVEALQRIVWPGSETDIVPPHLLLTAAHNGGLVVGAYASDRLVGFVFGFIGMDSRTEMPSFKHCSHMLGVHPEFRGAGLGFKLKRAQWQMVRRQGLELITWTYDPLMSPNAYLNLAKLGGVCNTYNREVYGEMRDGLNVGLPSDRFQVDWWINSRRVDRRLSKRARQPLDLAHFLAAGVEVLNRTTLDTNDLPLPPAGLPEAVEENASLLLVEIPADFQAIKSADSGLALRWRLHTRQIFEELFTAGYLATDFVHLTGHHPRSYYVLSRGDSTLGA